MAAKPAPSKMPGICPTPEGKCLPRIERVVNERGRLNAKMVCDECGQRWKRVHG